MKIRIGRNSYAIRKLKFVRKFWFHKWLPTWHDGRGYYISIGLYFIGLYKGY